MAYIYKNYKGDEVSSWSYSAGQTFGSCREKFRILKIAGFRQKGETAASKFGVAIEDAIQHFHSDNMKPESGRDHFKFRWLQFKEVPNLIYKEKEGSWEDFYKAGTELMDLYELTVPSLPITNPEFQLRYSREVFPGTELAGITDQGFVDMLSRASWTHPMLPKVNRPKGSAYRPVIIDIKVSGKMLDTTPNMLQLDTQLKRYSGFSGVKDVGFLWMQRMKPGSFDKGTEVTFLRDSGKWTKGLRGVVHESDEESQTAIVLAHHDQDRVKTTLSEIKGKGSTERKNELVAGWLADGTMTQVSTDDITKQRIRFVAVRVNDEDVIEENRVVAQQIVNARQASIDGFWPKDGAGVRFPNNRCVWCEARGKCLRDPQLDAALLVQISPSTPIEEDWLDQVQEED